MPARFPFFVPRAAAVLPFGFDAASKGFAVSWWLLWMPVLAGPVSAQAAPEAQVSSTASTETAAVISRWESSIAEYEKADEASMPSPGGVVFVGSSSVRLWKTLAEDFDGESVINRGFGGSQMTDSVEFADRIVTPYRPRAILVYAGDNDINAGKTPETVLQDFQAFVAKVHDELPDAAIAFITIKPSLKRWQLWPTMSEANELVKRYAETDPLVDVLDIGVPMLGEDGMPKPELFVADGLHLSAAGYAVWAGVVRPWIAAHPPREPAGYVFRGGTDGYPVFRIPALIQAANGDLLAFCEARQGGDASEIDLVMKRSTDGGQTWGPLQVLQESDDYRRFFSGDPPPITLGNPAPVVDRLDPEHPGRIWLPFTLENDRVFVTSSDDHGQTWSPPREITSDVKKPNWGWYATGPVHSIQIRNGQHRGRLVIPADHRLGTGGADKGPLGAQAILSDDHGKTWRLGAIDETYDDGLNANETTVVELADGTLYFNTRDQNGDAPGTRGEAWSNDGGETFTTRNREWASFQPAAPVLDPPVVQSALVGLSDGQILFSGPDDNGPTGAGRSDLRIRVSRDQAETWQDGPLLHIGPAAYSDLVEINDETLGVIYEAGKATGKNAYEGIRFQRLARKRLDLHSQTATSAE